MVGPASRVAGNRACGKHALLACAAAWLAAWAAPVAAQDYRVVAHCRDGYPHGAYELRTRSGQLRVSGAFNRGKRTSSFLFWTSSGVRVAHIPFDEDRKSGTLSLWYADAAPNAEPQQKLEAVFVAGRRNGVTRSWHANGELRAVMEYANGELVDVQAWTDAGDPLPPAAARALAARDREEDERYYASLDAVVVSHLPRCGGTPPGSQRARHGSDFPAARLAREP